MTTSRLRHRDHYLRLAEETRKQFGNLDPGWARQSDEVDNIRVAFETSRGRFDVMARTQWAPVGVDRFYQLVGVHYYDDARFFRVVKDFVAQFGISGDPRINTAWSIRRLADEPVRHTNSRGTISYARGGPGTRSVQLYINLRDNPRLDTLAGFGFPPIAEIVQGMAVVDSLYSGYGESAGQPSESGLYSDGRAALAYLRSRPDVDAGRIVVWGRSIGSAVAVEVAADASEAGRNRAAEAAPLAGVILESPFTSIPELLGDGGHRVLLVLSFFGTYRFDSTTRIGRVAAPVLVIHGTADDIAPIRLGRRLFERVPGRRQFVPIEGGGHNDLWALHEDEVWDAARRFLETLE